MASHNYYWSCTTFADWLRGTPKPVAETGSGWRDWRKSAQAAHPFRYWLADKALDKVQDIVYWPATVLYDIKYYINNRWVTRTHALTSSSLPKGKWCDLDCRILHCLFDELVNHVEVELAWSNIAWNKEDRVKYNVPFYAAGWFRWRVWRCPQAGLDYLTWSSGLKHNDEWDDKDGPEYNKPTRQAVAATEVLALYDWWKTVRPVRPDPYDDSGWSEICARRRSEDDDFLAGLEDRTDEERAESIAALARCAKIEQQHEDEDTEMLTRLIRIRKSLWT